MLFTRALRREVCESARHQDRDYLSCGLTLNLTQHHRVTIAYVPEDFDQGRTNIGKQRIELWQLRIAGARYCATVMYYRSEPRNRRVNARLADTSHWFSSILYLESFKQCQLPAFTRNGLPSDPRIFTESFWNVGRAFPLTMSN
jgi:hypothetical protein